jgi:hypothetical protein
VTRYRANWHAPDERVSEGPPPTFREKRGRLSPRFRQPRARDGPTSNLVTVPAPSSAPRAHGRTGRRQNVHVCTIVAPTRAHGRTVRNGRGAPTVSPDCASRARAGCDACVAFAALRRPRWIQLYPLSERETGRPREGDRPAAVGHRAEFPHVYALVGILPPTWQSSSKSAASSLVAWIGSETGATSGRTITSGDVESFHRGFGRRAR